MHDCVCVRLVWFFAFRCASFCIVIIFVLLLLFPFRWPKKLLWDFHGEILRQPPPPLPPQRNKYHSTSNCKVLNTRTHTHTYKNGEYVCLYGCGKDTLATFAFSAPASTSVCRHLRTSPRSHCCHSIDRMLPTLAYAAVDIPCIVVVVASLTFAIVHVAVAIFIIISRGFSSLFSHLHLYTHKHAFSYTYTYVCWCSNVLAYVHEYVKLWAKCFLAALCASIAAPAFSRQIEWEKLLVSWFPMSFQ